MNKKIDLSLVRQMRNGIMKDHPELAKFSINDFYKLMVRSSMINENGTPTKFAFEKGLITWKPE